MCSLVLLLFLIGGYNTVLAMREQRDEIARLTAELEGSKMTVSALKEQQAKTTENTAAEALKGADAKNTDGGWKDGTYEGYWLSLTQKRRIVPMVLQMSI